MVNGVANKKVVFTSSAYRPIDFRNNQILQNALSNFFFIRTCQDNIKYPSFSPAIAIVMGRNRGTEWEPGIQAVHIRTNTPSPADNIIDLAFLCIRHARNH